MNHGFKDDGIYCIFCANRKEENHNDLQFSNFKKNGPVIAKITAENSELDSTFNNISKRPI